MAIGVLNGNNINWDLIEFDHNNGVFNAAGEGISFGTIEVTGTLSGSDQLQVNSAVYDTVTFRRWQGDEVVTVAGDATTAFDYDGNSATVALSNDTNFSLTHASGGSWQVDDFAFTVEVDALAIPEPSSTALLGLGGLTLILRRRK